MGDLVDLDKYRENKEAVEQDDHDLEDLREVLAELGRDPEFINAGLTGIYIPLEEMVKYSEREEPPEPPIVTRLELLQAAFEHFINALRPWRKK
jgi:hypothetical protein